MNIRYVEIELRTKGLEAVAVKLTNGLIIASVYNPPQNKINVNELNSIFKSGDKVLLYGDLKAKNMAWNCNKANANGRLIQKYAHKNYFKIIAPDGFTLYPYSGALPSVVDIGLAKNIDCDIELNVVDNVSSDHNPVKIILDKNDKIVKQTRSYLNYKTADWSKFRST